MAMADASRRSVYCRVLASRQAAGLRARTPSGEHSRCSRPSRESNIRTVPVSLNGVTRFMVLDTGGAVTQLSRDTIEDLKLPVRRSSAAAYDINGRVSHHFAMVKDFTFGDLHRADAALMVWPEPTRPFAGELAQDMLQPYDVDVDFASGVLKMYAKGHCPGPSGLDAAGAGGNAQQGLAPAYPGDAGRPSAMTPSSIPARATPSCGCPRPGAISA